MKRHLAALLATTMALIPALALAQGAVQQVGPATKYDSTGFIGDHQIESASKMFNDNNRGLNPAHTFDGAGPGSCWEDAPTTGPYHQFCITHDVSGNAVFGLTANGGAPSAGLNFNINGTAYTFPGTGNGNVVGPNSTMINHLAVWANTAGTLLGDTTAITTTQLLNNVSNLVTTNTQGAIPGSVGQGALYFDTVRTGGYGQYGNALFHYETSAATPSPQFDVGVTSWATHHNLTGGGIFGGWIGANSPAKNKGEIYTGGAVVGAEINYGNRWSNFGFQDDVGSTFYTVGLQVVPDVIPATGADNSVALTSFASGSPATFTLNSHGFYANMGVVFSNTAGVSGLSDGTTYFVASTGLTTNSFQVSTTIGGAAVNTSGTPSGPIMVLPSWPGNFGIVIGASVHGHQTWLGNLTRVDSIAPGGWVHWDNGGSVASDAPFGWAKIYGYYYSGIDMINATFASNHAIALTTGQQIYLDGATVVGGSGAINIVTGPGTAIGSLMGNGYGAGVSLSWAGNGSAPELSFFGAAPQLQPTGYGTPTNVSLTTNFPGTSATLSQTAGTLAALITHLKTLGLLGN